MLFVVQRTVEERGGRHLVRRGAPAAGGEHDGSGGHGRHIADGRQGPPHRRAASQRPPPPRDGLSHAGLATNASGLLLHACPAASIALLGSQSLQYNTMKVEIQVESFVVGSRVLRPRVHSYSWSQKNIPGRIRSRRLTTLPVATMPLAAKKRGYIRPAIRHTCAYAWKKRRVASLISVEQAKVALEAHAHSMTMDSIEQICSN